MKRRAMVPMPAAGDAAPGAMAGQSAEAGGSAGNGGSRDGPVILFSYPHSGAQRVQDLLSAGKALACTSSTGIIPLCAAAAETWRRVEGRDGLAMSRLAVATVRGLVSAQMTAILAGAGKDRWCELATADPGAAKPFLQVFPHAVFVCVHRRCPEVIRAAVQANPWGLQGQGLAPYLLTYLGNSVAALAACWANSTEDLLVFEDTNPHNTCRVRYEDVATGPGETLMALRAWLGLDDGGRVTLPEQFFSSEPDAQRPPPTPQVPVEMIPLPLRERISRLHVELGYAPLPG